MKKATITALIALAGVSVALSAHAGVNYGTAVIMGSNYAMGAVYETRHSASTSEYIWCYARSWSTFEQGVCYARDAAGTFKMCVTSDPEQISTIRSIGPASEIYFRVADPSGCEFVSVANGSAYLD